MNEKRLSLIRHYIKEHTASMEYRKATYGEDYPLRERDEKHLASLVAQIPEEKKSKVNPLKASKKSK